MSTYFSGQGSIYLAPRDVDGKPMGFRFIGNCASFFVKLGRGALRYAADLPASALVPAEAMPSLTFDLESLHHDNLALLLGGAVTVVPAGSAEDELTVYSGCSTPLSHIRLTEFTQLESEDGTDIYTVDVDYRVKPETGSIEIIEGSSIEDGATVVATYEHDAYVTVGAYTNVSAHYAVRFEGINTANGSPVTVDIFKVRIQPVDEVSFISDNPSVLRVNGRILQDTAIAGTPPEGKLLRIRQLQ